MLRTFGALPTEARAREMKGRDYLWCLVHLLLDREEELEQLCPACRARAMEERCPACGRETGGPGERADNPAFDRARFEQLRGGRSG